MEKTREVPLRKYVEDEILKRQEASAVASNDGLNCYVSIDIHCPECNWIMEKSYDNNKWLAKCRTPMCSLRDKLFEIPKITLSAI